MEVTLGVFCVLISFSATWKRLVTCLRTTVQGGQELTGQEDRHSLLSNPEAQPERLISGSGAAWSAAALTLPIPTDSPVVAGSVPTHHCPSLSSWLAVCG